MFEAVNDKLKKKMCLKRNLKVQVNLNQKLSTAFTITMTALEANWAQQITFKDFIRVAICECFC